MYVYDLATARSDVGDVSRELLVRTASTGCCGHEDFFDQSCPDGADTSLSDSAHLAKVKESLLRCRAFTFMRLQATAIRNSCYARAAASVVFCWCRTPTPSHQHRISTLFAAQSLSGEITLLWTCLGGAQYALLRIASPRSVRQASNRSSWV